MKSKGLLHLIMQQSFLLYPAMAVWLAMTTVSTPLMSISQNPFIRHCNGLALGVHLCKICY